MTNTITLNQKELKEVLKVFKTLCVQGKVITSKNQYNIENNIMLCYQDNILNIIGTDGATFIKYSIKVKESNMPNFSVCLLLKKLDSIVKEMEKDIDFELSLSINERITIKYNNSSHTIIGMSSVDFPAIPKVENNNVISINDVTNFKKAITKANKTSAKESIKHSLQSVYFDIINQNSINVVATNGRSLFQEMINCITIDNSNEINNILVNNAPIDALILAIKKDTTSMTIASDSECSRFTFDNYQITTYIIDSKFPNYKTIIPQNHKAFITLNKKEVLKAMKIVKTMANSKSIYIKSFNQNIYIVGIDENIGQSQVEVDSTHEHYNDFDLAFNYKLFEKTLKAIDDDLVKISFSDNNEPATFNDKDILMMLNNDTHVEILTKSYDTSVVKTKEAITLKSLPQTTINIKEIEPITHIKINPFIREVYPKVEYNDSVKRTIVFRDLQAESRHYYRHYKAA